VAVGVGVLAVVHVCVGVGVLVSVLVSVSVLVGVGHWRLSRRVNSSWGITTSVLTGDKASIVIIVRTSRHDGSGASRVVLVLVGVLSASSVLVRMDLGHNMSPLLAELSAIGLMHRVLVVDWSRCSSSRGTIILRRASIEL